VRENTAMHPSAQKHIYDYFIDDQGNWFCEGNPVTDPQLFRLLSRSLYQQDGRYYVRCEGEINPVRVAAFPLWIRYVHVETDAGGNLTAVDIELQDGRREALAPHTLRTASDEALYCRATHRRLKARFAKVAYYELTRYLQMDAESSRFYFVIDGRRYDVLPDAEG